MRSKKALLNTIAGLSYELVALICGFILPRLILSAFGSSYNGITSSITQFLGYVSLLRAGIGGVTKAAIYKPLSENNSTEISGVINATNAFLRKVSIVFVISLIGFAAIYPIFVCDDFEWFFTFSLVLILGISTFVQYFFGLTYQFLLQSDQRNCVISIVQIGTTILNTILAAILIKLGATIHMVKLGSAIAFSLNPILINFYARKYYNIDKTVLPNHEAIKDRWDCFGLQVANFVNTNTDMFVLTVFANILEVSVYSIYHMVLIGIKKLLSTFVNSFGSAFGNMFAKNERALINKNLRIYEQIVFAMTNFAYTVALVTMLPFVKIYTSGIEDVNYIRPVFSAVIVVASMFGSYRIPYQSLVEAVGHFKQTRNGAFFEAIMNIVVSITMVKFFGLVGVAIGTLCAAIFRTLQYSIYLSKHVVNRSMWIVVKRIILSAITVSVICGLSQLLPAMPMNNIVDWAIYAVLVSIIAGIVVFLVEFLFYRSDLIETTHKVTNIFRRRRK